MSIASVLTRLAAAKTAIADAITAKGGTVAQGDGFEDFAVDIATIPAGSSAVLVSKAITENGTYDPADDSADGYSSVTVTVPDTARGIIDRSVTSVVIPNTATSVDKYLFYYCTSLTTATFEPTSQVTTLDTYCFGYCNNLTSITFPNSIRTAAQAFEGCSNLENVLLNEGLQTIGWGCFQSCQKIGRIKIPSTVTSIAGQAFYRCSSLEIDCTELTVTNGAVNTQLGAISAFQLISNISFIFATQAIRDVYATATNWSAFANFMTYVGA